MRVLVTWGSKRGGTEGIARVIGQTLVTRGFDVTLLPAQKAGRAGAYDAAIVGGALYATRWHHAARSFVNHHERALRRVPVWFFSSGPLDNSAQGRDIPATKNVEILMERVGAKGHVTFGGRLAADAKGFPASAMARKVAGDYRDMDRVRAWASEIAEQLPTARPGAVIAQRGHSLVRLFLHALTGWALCGFSMGVLLALLTPSSAALIHALLAPLIFVFVSRHYFAARGAREPLDTAMSFVAVVMLLDLVLVAGVLGQGLVMFTSLAATWLPFLLIFLATWVTGEIASISHWTRESARAANPS